MPRPAYGFATYLVVYAFTFTDASWEFPPTCVSMPALIVTVTLTFDLLTSKLVHGLLV